VVTILPVLVQGLPASWQTTITRYLPSAAGQAVIGHTKFAPHGHLLSPWLGFSLFHAYAVIALIAGADPKPQGRLTPPPKHTEDGSGTQARRLGQWARTAVTHTA
jgi:hypothetical protein